MHILFEACGGVFLGIIKAKKTRARILLLKLFECNNAWWKSSECRALGWHCVRAHKRADGGDHRAAYLRFRGILQLMRCASWMMERGKFDCVLFLCFE